MPTESASKATPLDKARTPAARRAVAKRTSNPGPKDHFGGVTMFAVVNVRPDPDNVRTDVGDITDLTKSIAEKGVLQPLTVTKDGDGYMVVFGHRRLAAAIAAGLTHVPGVVREFDPLDRLETQIAENLHRADLTPIEEARAYARLAELGASQHRMVTKVARSQSHISKRLSLLKLPDAVQDKIAADELTIGDALELTKLADLPDSRKLISGAMSQARTPGAMHFAVADALRKHDLAEKRAAAFAQLDAEKVPTVKYQPYRPYSADYTPIGKGWDDLDVPVATCKKDGTLAGTVRTDGTIQYVCTDAKRYMAKITGTPTETAAQKRERLGFERETQAMVEAADARMIAGTKLVQSLDRKPDPLLRLLAIAAAKYLDIYDTQRVVQMVGLVLDDGDDEWAALEEHYLKGDSELLRVAAACALVAADPDKRRSWHDANGAVIREHDILVDTLTALADYQPTAWELDKLGRTAAPAPAPAKPARARKG